MSVDELIRYAHRLLDAWHANLSPSRVTRLCRDYHRMAAARIPFEHYMLNNADLSELQCVRIRTSIGTLDPTGQIAAANVDRERRAQGRSKLAG
ncbi:hypothetical protein [Pimelobacter simplex]|uniref:hypothetical protein n=1 Tax=Nocardioides simplex TaxID=2045 RepID=UPI0019335A0D|nr:hypothetical protein [Pimelobacter simplex]